MWARRVVRAWCVVWAGLCVGVVLAFCPSGCKCNNHFPSATCVGVGLNVLPILFNPGLRRLNLAHNLLTSVGQSLVFFEHLEELDLSNNLLHSLDTGSLENQKRLRELRLAHNNLTSLSPGALLGLQHLRLLDLSHNGMVELPAGVLVDTPHLTVLLLAHNKLHALPHHTFRGLHSLLVLDLCNNYFRDVPSLSLEHLHVLKSLQLCRNRITRLGSHAFTTPALVSLSLETNNIDFAASDAFSQLQELKQLNLNDNLLREIPRAPASLQLLIFSKNNITTIGVQDLENLGRLSKLDISRCPHLRELHPDAFSHCVSLEHLLVSHNPLLRQLPDKLFASLPRLASLDLRANSLETLRASSLPLPTLKHLDLRGNRLVCNCSLRWLPPLLAASNTSLVVPDVQCAAPDKLRGLFLSRVGRDQLCGGGVQAVVVGVMLCCSALLLTALGVLLCRYRRRQQLEQRGEKLSPMWAPSSLAPPWPPPSPLHHTHTYTQSPYTHTNTQSPHTHTNTQPSFTHTYTLSPHTHTYTQPPCTHTYTQPSFTHTSTQPSFTHTSTQLPYTHTNTQPPYTHINTQSPCTHTYTPNHPFKNIVPNYPPKYQPGLETTTMPTAVHISAKECGEKEVPVVEV